MDGIGAWKVMEVTDVKGSESTKAVEGWSGLGRAMGGSNINEGHSPPPVIGPPFSRRYLRDRHEKQLVNARTGRTSTVIPVYSAA